MLTERTALDENTRHLRFAECAVMLCWPLVVKIKFTTGTFPISSFSHLTPNWLCGLFCASMASASSLFLKSIVTMATAPTIENTIIWRNFICQFKMHWFHIIETNFSFFAQRLETGEALVLFLNTLLFLPPRTTSTRTTLSPRSTRRTTGVHRRPRCYPRERAKCPAAAQTRSVSDTNAVATTAASTPAWNPSSRHQVRPQPILSSVLQKISFSLQFTHWRPRLVYCTVLDWLVQPKPRWLGGNGWLLDGPEEVLQGKYLTCAASKV